MLAISVALFHPKEGAIADLPELRDPRDHTTRIKKPTPILAPNINVSDIHKAAKLRTTARHGRHLCKLSLLFCEPEVRLN